MVFICAIDIETSGPNLIKNAILSIGYCIGDIYGNIHIKERIDLKMPEECGFDKQCYDEFWINHLEKLKIFKNSALDPQEGIKQFTDTLDSFGNELIIISDNPSFDIGFINYYICKYSNRKPLNYDNHNNYRPIYDTDGYTRGRLHIDYDYIWTSDTYAMRTLGINVLANPDHMPENDAEYIYELHRKIVYS